MNSFAFLLVCAQAFFIQSALGQCLPCGNAPAYPAIAPAYPAIAPAYPAIAPVYPAIAPAYPAIAPAYPAIAPTYPAIAPACSAPAPYYDAPAPYYPAPAPYPSAPGNLWGGSYGISVVGDNLSIDGDAQVSGAMPFVSSVQLDGDVPAEGAATLRNACCCGDRYL